MKTALFPSRNRAGIQSESAPETCIPAQTRTDSVTRTRDAIPAPVVPPVGLTAPDRERIRAAWSEAIAWAVRMRSRVAAVESATRQPSAVQGMADREAASAGGAQ